MNKNSIKISQISEQINNFKELTSREIQSILDFVTWKYNTICFLEPVYKNKLVRLISVELDNPDENDSLFYPDTIVKQVIVLLEDQLYKLKEHGDIKKDLGIRKLLKAREENLNFENEIADMICGINKKFPFKSVNNIKDFFQELNCQFNYNGSFSKKNWIINRLKEISAPDIYNIIAKGVFKKKYFLEGKKNVEKAKEEFKKFIDNSIKENDVFDISDAFDLNINTDLLFNQEIKTKDDSLNKLIEQARELFVQKNKQLALEKIWDAFERMKTLLGKDKKQSANLLISKISRCLDKDFYQNEFLKLTDIGNNYKIRHFETDKKPIDDTNEQEYLFFRMLSLINLCLANLEK